VARLHLGELLEEPVDLVLDTVQLEERLEGFHGWAPGNSSLI
jgi:hypothetical protein